MKESNKWIDDFTFDLHRGGKIPDQTHDPVSLLDLGKVPGFGDPVEHQQALRGITDQFYGAVYNRLFFGLTSLDEAFAREVVSYWVPAPREPATSTEPSSPDPGPSPHRGSPRGSGSGPGRT